MKSQRYVQKFCLTVFTALGVAVSVNAHTGLKESIPAAGSTVQTAPSQIVLMFTGPVRLIKLDVVGETEAQVSFRRSSQPESIYRVALAGLAKGEYEVEWAAIGADGHTMADSFRFVLDFTNIESSAP
ncbi:MAG: hypothetical protein CMD92_04240 [Gammaproteobacteria bacterium]|nr:hypothetical protein [Gammaproteobacteria bacterium]HBW83507.1 hypothetical protein [Gammaproteobacteria bacterium]